MSPNKKANKKHEVEYRALINKNTFTRFLREAKKFKKGAINPILVQDTYFCPKKVKSFKEIEMNKIGSFSLRLRREIKNKKENTILNTKIIKNTGDHNAWLENEVLVSSYEECSAILKAIGFKIFFELKKRRYNFTDKGIKVFLEDIENFQPAIEVEIMTSEDKTNLAKKKLLDYLSKQNIKEENIVKKSITNLLMRERASF